MPRNPASTGRSSPVALAAQCPAPLRPVQLPGHAQDQHRRIGGAAECRAHLALCGEGARLFRKALHRRQHHAVRGRPVADLGGRGGAGHRHRQRQRCFDRPRPEGAADLGPRAAHAAGLHGAGRDQERGRTQGQAAVRDRRRRRRLQLAHGPRGAQVRRATRATRSSFPPPPRAACPDWSPARSTAWRCTPRTCSWQKSRRKRYIRWCSSST